MIKFVTSVCEDVILSFKKKTQLNLFKHYKGLNIFDEQIEMGNGKWEKNENFSTNKNNKKGVKEERCNKNNKDKKERVNKNNKDKKERFNKNNKDKKERCNKNNKDKKERFNKNNKDKKERFNKNKKDKKERCNKNNKKIVNK